MRLSVFETGFRLRHALLLLALILLAAVGTGLWWQLNNGLFISRPGDRVYTEPRPVKVDVRSEIDGLQLAVSPDTDRWLEAVFEALDYDFSRQMIDFDTGQQLYPKQVTFVFKQINTLTAAERSSLFHTIGPRDRPLVGHQSVQTGRYRLEYIVYIDLEDLPNWNRDGLAKNLSFHLLNSLYTANPSLSKTEASRMQAWIQVESLGFVPFKLTIMDDSSSTNNQLQLFGRLAAGLSILLPGQAYANPYPPECPGSTFMCGTAGEIWHCSNDPERHCRGVGDDAFCGDGNTCIHGGSGCWYGGGGESMGCNNLQQNVGSCTEPQCPGHFCYIPGTNGCMGDPPPGPSPPPGPTPPPPPPDCTELTGTWECYDGKGHPNQGLIYRERWLTDGQIRYSRYLSSEFATLDGPWDDWLLPWNGEFPWLKPIDYKAGGGTGLMPRGRCNREAIWQELEWDGYLEIPTAGNWQFKYVQGTHWYSDDNVTPAQRTRIYMWLWDQQTGQFFELFNTHGLGSNEEAISIGVSPGTQQNFEGISLQAKRYKLFARLHNASDHSIGPVFRIFYRNSGDSSFQVIPLAQLSPCEPEYGPPTCTVSLSSSQIYQGDPVTVSLSGTANDPVERPVKLWASKQTGGSINPEPNDTFYRWPQSPPHYLFQVPGCNSDLQSCSTTYTYINTANVEPGYYYFHCDIIGAVGGSVTGHPFCQVNGNWLNSVIPEPGRVVDCTNHGYTAMPGGVQVLQVLPPPTVDVRGRACYQSDPTLGQPACIGSCSPFPTTFTATLNLSPYGTRTFSGNGWQQWDNVVRPAPGNSLQMTIGGYNTANWQVTPSAGFSLNPTHWAGGNPIERSFCVTDIADPWFQAFGGDVGAHGPVNTANITTQVPIALYEANTSPKNRLSMPIVINPVRDAGIFIAHGNLNVSGQAIRDLANWRARLGLTRPVSGNYASFWNSFDMGTVSSIGPTFNQALLNEGPEGPAYYRQGALNITSLNVPHGLNRTIFVQGNVTVTGNILVAARNPVNPNSEPGGFLAVIATGNITFNTGVNDAQGIYIANNRLVINLDNTGTYEYRQFRGEGVFAGHGGVTLSRDLRGNAGDPAEFDNNRYPAEKFTYRPDLLLNAPDGFKRFSIQWQEIAPVTQ
jgi:hypothetical protein